MTSAADALAESEAGTASGPPHVGFVQMARIVQSASPEAAPIGGLGPVAAEAVRFRAALSLAFPSGEVEQVERIPNGDGQRWRISVNLPALYGPSSPLPTFITERLMREDPDGLSRAFVDLINHRVLSLLYRLSERHHAPRHCARRAQATAAMLGIDGHPELARYAALLAGERRSADDLLRLLRHRFAPLAIDLLQCVHARTRLSAERLVRLAQRNHRLGIDCVVGDTVSTRATGFRISIAGVPVERLCDFMPGGSAHAELARIVARFNPGALDWEVELLLSGPTVEIAALGGATACLGRGGRLAGDAAVSYPLRVVGSSG